MENIIFNKGEKLKTVKDYPNYSISNHGRLLSIAHGTPKWVKPSKDAMGYLHARLYNDVDVQYYKNGQKKPKLEKIHRLVAQAFIKTLSKKKVEVNHKDCDKTNNHVDNLEWVTRKKNLHHAWKNGRMVNVHKTGTLKRSHPVKVTYKDGRIIYFHSKTHAHVSLKCSPTIIIDLCQTGRWSPKFGFKVEEIEKIPDFIDGIPAGVTYVTPESLSEKLNKYYNKYYPPRKWSQL